jgi:hypothetical protein
LKLTFWSVVLGSFAFSVHAQDRAAPDTVHFAQVVLAHFATWDADRDGRLSAKEVDALTVDPQFKGPEAAALAALKLGLRSEKITPPPITREYLEQLKNGGRNRPGTSKAEAAAVDDFIDHPDTAAGQSVNFERSYTNILGKIQRASRELFADGAPDIKTLSQGPLGDCYFVSVIGAATYRNASDISKVLSMPDAGTYEARFPGQKPVKFKPLTDVEVAISSTGGSGGLWLAVLEKALGTLRHEARPESHHAAEEPTDYIANGGNAGEIIQLLTGNDFLRLSLGNRKGAAGAAFKNSDTALDQLRGGLKSAFAEHRLVTAGTPGEDAPMPMPPGVTRKHAYAVLGYDAQADTVRLWNPHGNAFKPAGAPGLKQGYVTQAGMFDMRLADFAQVFGSIVFETALQQPRRLRG